MWLLTRARYCLWVLRNEKTLSRSDTIWKRLVCNARDRRCLFNADEDKTLTEALIDKDSILLRSARWKDSEYIQVLRIWDVVPLEDVSKLIKKLDSIVGVYTDDFLNHYKECSLQGELEVPRTWRK